MTSPAYTWLAVAVGGAAGALARWRLSQLAASMAPSLRFPTGTLVVNLLGCLAIGALAGLAGRSWGADDPHRLFLFTGLLGGFTTFSAFGLETVDLLRRGELLPAGGYVAASVLGGVLAVWLGLALVQAAR